MFDVFEIEKNDPRTLWEIQLIYARHLILPLSVYFDI